MHKDMFQFINHCDRIILELLRWPLASRRG